MGIAALRAALLLASVLALFHAVPATNSAAAAHGRDLVAQYELPAEQVALYRARAEKGTAARTSLADPSLWLGPKQAVGIGRNPYTLVLSIGGVAPASGDVRTHWQAGWEVHEAPQATRDLLMPMAALSSGRVNAGTPLTLTVVGGPVTFRGEREVAPMLNLVQAQNFEIQTVRLAVWSGTAAWAWPQLTAPHLALLLLGLLCAAAWYALRPRPLLAPASGAPLYVPSSTLPPAPASQLPEIDLQALLEHRSSAVAAPIQPALPPAPAPSRPDHAANVVAVLRHVLSAGLAVPTELDHGRTRKPRRGLRPG